MCHDHGVGGGEQMLDPSDDDSDEEASDPGMIAHGGGGGIAIDTGSDGAGAGGGGGGGGGGSDSSSDSSKLLIVRAGLPRADTAYLLDLLRAGNPVLCAAIDLFAVEVAVAAAVNQSPPPSAIDELNDTLSRLGMRWRAQSVVLDSLAEAVSEYPQLFALSDTDLDMLHALVYAADPTLLHSHERFIAIRYVLSVLSARV